VERLDIAELLGLVLDEGRSGEEDLGVDEVVLDEEGSDVVGIDLDLTGVLVDLDVVDLLGGLLGFLDLLLLLIV
jgi:hypothetical protein